MTQTCPLLWLSSCLFLNKMTYEWNDGHFVPSTNGCSRPISGTLLDPHSRSRDATGSLISGPPPCSQHWISKALSFILSKVWVLLPLHIVSLLCSYFSLTTQLPYSESMSHSWTCISLVKWWKFSIFWPAHVGRKTINFSYLLKKLNVTKVVSIVQRSTFYFFWNGI